MGSWQGVFRAIQIARGKHKHPLSDCAVQWTDTVLVT